LIQSEIKQVLADEILFGQLQNGGKVEIDLGEDGLVFRYKPRGADEPAKTPQKEEELTLEVVTE
jgi:ATP-dependent Clp protease ATP-binding subunit ClpA